MKKIVLICFALVCTTLSFAQGNIAGHWATIDDSTGEKKAIVEIYKANDGAYYGKIVSLFGQVNHTTCVKCKGKLKDKPLVGMLIIKGMKESGDELSGGTILDPASGKEYKCDIRREADELHVRGYVMNRFFGRSQVWKKIKMN